MKGFDAKFKDFPDYIIGITEEIWEKRGLATLHNYYSPDIVVRSPSSVVVGNKDVIGATMATLAEFPDRQLLGEDVIWSGTPEEGMLSSHRILTTATHKHSGAYGKATGKHLRYRVIADCHAINNQINDEWLIRDQAAIVKQLDISPQDYARQQIANEGGPEKCNKPFSAEIDQRGPYAGTGNDNEWGQRLSDTLSRIMNADIAVIQQTYDRAATLEYPGGDTCESFSGAEEFWMGLRASFPSAQFKAEHVIGREDPFMPPRAAVRWSLQGKHDGIGRFGMPTGNDVYVMGITHAEYGAHGSSEPKLRREWTLFDDTAIWKQILMQAGDV